MSFLLRLLLLLLIPAVVWGQALHQEKVGLYNANKAGNDCSQATLASADTQALALNQVLLIPPTDRFGAPCQWTVSSNMTIASPAFFPYDGPAPVLKVNDDITLTLTACPVVWSDYFIIDANGTTTGTVVYTPGCNQCTVSGDDSWTKCTVASEGGGGGGATTEAQLETQLTDVADVFTDNDGILGATTEAQLELDLTDVTDVFTNNDGILGATTEPELEADLTDVDDVFTNNDGALNEDNLADNLISDLQDVDSASIGSLGQILLGNGTGYIAATWPACNLTDQKVHFDPDTSTLSCQVDAGAATTVTLDQAFDNGTGEINSALCGTKSVKISNGGDDYLEICVDASGSPQITGTCDGAGCDNVQSIAVDRNFILHDSEATLDMWNIDPDAATRHDKYQILDGYQLLDSIKWPAWAMFGNGTQCDVDPAGTVPTQGILCSMPGTDTDGLIVGTPVTLPGDFDKTADVIFSVKAYLTTDSGAGTWHGHMKIDCVGQGEVHGTYTPTTGIGLDLTPDVADIVGDEIHDVGAGVIDTDTTGADCDPGDTIYWRYNLCDTDGTPSDGCTSSAGFEDDMRIFSVEMQYKKNSLSE